MPTSACIANSSGSISGTICASSRSSSAHMCLCVTHDWDEQRCGRKRAEDEVNLIKIRVRAAAILARKDNGRQQCGRGRGSDKSTSSHQYQAAERGRHRHQTRRATYMQFPLLCQGCLLSRLENKTILQVRFRILKNKCREKQKMMAYLVLRLHGHVLLEHKNREQVLRRQKEESRRDTDNGQWAMGARATRQETEKNKKRKNRKNRMH